MQFLSQLSISHSRMYLYLLPSFCLFSDLGIFFGHSCILFLPGREEEEEIMVA